jgi:Cobalamin synthesis protein cobW C-terminal domain
VRAKGLLCFAEEPSVRAVFNLSGRRRCSFEHGGLWSGPAQQHLVMIGAGLQSEPLLSALRAMEVPAAAPHSAASDCSNGSTSGSSSGAAAAGATAGAVLDAECCCDANSTAECSVQHTCAEHNNCNHSSSSCCCSEEAACAKHTPAAADRTAASAAAHAENSSSISSLQAAATQARALIESSEARGMYEWLTPHDSSSSNSSSNNSKQQSAAAPAAVLFRLTGQGLYKLTPQQLRIKHGVDLDAVNASIAQVSTQRNNTTHSTVF